MANPYFKFKQFTIWHDKCAMKVGTDGALLGAWAAPKEARNILDIGTGTGLVALMLAQRCQAFIDAIDIDADACLQAEENVARSPFADRIRVHHCALNDFHPSAPSHYDLIVSNPPYIPTEIWKTLDPSVRDFEPRLALDGGDDGLNAKSCLQVERKMQTPDSCGNCGLCGLACLYGTRTL